MPIGHGARTFGGALKISTHCSNTPLCWKTRRQIARPRSGSSVTFIFVLPRSIRGDQESERALYRLLERSMLWGQIEYYSDLYLRQRGENPERLFYKALALYHSEQFDKAQPLYEQLAAQQPLRVDRPDIYDNLARIYQTRACRSKRMSFMCRPLRLPPAMHGYTRDERNSGSKQIGQRPRWRTPRRPWALNPECPEALLFMALRAAEEKDLAAAAAYAKRGLPHAKDPAPFYSLLALVYQNLGQVDEAIALLADMDPVLMADRPQFFVTLAEHQISQGRFDAAAETVAKYRRSHPNHTMIFEYIEARELLAKSKASEAIPKLLTVVQNQPTTAPPLFYLIIAYLQTQQRDLARTHLQNYISLHPRRHPSAEAIPDGVWPPPDWHGSACRGPGVTQQ
jgi:tetratricopeptide (TPR) repeat protein